MKSPVIAALALAGTIQTGCTTAPTATPASPQAEAIRQNRMGTIVITTAPGAAVHVEQVRHEFWFGAALANQAFDGTMPPAAAARYREVFLANFNSAVTENALKWREMERVRGQVNYATVNAILDWTTRNGIPLRGHNIYWGFQHWVQPWLKSSTTPPCGRSCRPAARISAGATAAASPSTTSTTRCSTAISTPTGSGPGSSPRWPAG